MPGLGRALTLRGEVAEKVAHEHFQKQISTGTVTHSDGSMEVDISNFVVFETVWVNVILTNIKTPCWQQLCISRAVKVCSHMFCKKITFGQDVFCKKILPINVQTRSSLTIHKRSWTDNAGTRTGWVFFGVFNSHGFFQAQVQSLPCLVPESLCTAVTLRCQLLSELLKLIRGFL